jgi:hypothetical protein
MWNLDLSAAIQAERTRDVERRTRDWRLLHPDPVDETPSMEPILPIRRRPTTERRRAPSGSACEAI